MTTPHEATFGEVTVDGVFPEDQALVASLTDEAAMAVEFTKAIDDLTWYKWSDVGQMNYADFPPIKHVTQLTLNQKYPIVAIRRVRDDCVSEIIFSV